VNKRTKTNCFSGMQTI